MNLIIIFILLIFSTTSVISYQGADYGGVEIISYSDAKCLASKYNVTFMTLLASSFGTVGVSSCTSLANLQTAGIQSRDASLFPCPNCDTTALQLSSLNSYLTTSCPEAWTGRIWIQVTNYEYWNTPWYDIGYSRNREIMNDFVDQCILQSLDCGIYTTSTQWLQIFGKDKPYTYPADNGLPLWVYPADPAEDFQVYSLNKFGGWDVPYAKQQVPGSYSSSTCDLFYLGLNWAPFYE
jgi:hypothetical protein